LIDSQTSPPIESALVRRLLDGDFALTAEITPPVSAGSEELLSKTTPVSPFVDAVNVTDGASARVHLSSLASAGILKANGIEPIVQFTCRDRNRIALISDLLGAGAQNINNLLILTGDDPTAGDQPQAKPVFDLKSHELITIAHEMTTLGLIPSKGSKMTSEGINPSTRKIDTPPNFFLGAADIPVTTNDEKWISSLRKKKACGTQFVQTQLNYDMDCIRSYAKILNEEGFTETMFFLIGTGPIPSARSAIWMRDNLWGVVMPDTIVKRLETAKDPLQEGIKICAEHLQELSEIAGVSGAHLMAPINVKSIPACIELASLKKRH
jgi:methylenetetrahydrofolate reductase (NADPH)